MGCRGPGDGAAKQRCWSSPILEVEVECTWFGPAGSPPAFSPHTPPGAYPASPPTDGGGTFADLGTLPTSAAGDAGDPALARDNVSGKIYFATLGYSSSNVIQVFRSTDDGATFSAPVNGAPGFASGVQLDKEWITVDNAPGAGQGNVYLVFTDFPNLFTDNGVYLTRSTDGGNTWSAPLSLGGSQGGYVTVGPDHSVYVFEFAGGSPNKI